MTPHPIDVAVGQRVLQGRKLRCISQEKLGERLDLTFQQIQKYEKGLNRISASKLAEIAIFLQFPVAWFFIDVEQKSAPTWWDDLHAVAEKNPTLKRVLKYLALGKPDEFRCFIVGKEST